MLDKRGRLLSSILASASAHFLVIAFFVSDVVSCTTNPYTPVGYDPPESEIVAAKAIPQAEIDDIYKRKAEQERQRREAEAQRQREAKAAEERKRRQLELEKQRHEEQERAKKAKHEELLRAKREVKIQAQKKQEELHRQQALEFERQRKAESEERRRREEQAQREREEQAQREREEQAQREREEQAQREREEQAQREEQVQREREEEARKREADALHQRRMIAWQRRYVSDIRRSIEKRWRKPRTSVQGGDCVVKIRQDESGKLLEVNVISCSGDLLYRRSVEDAVWKSEPLPLPPSPDVFENEIEITFRQQY